MDTDAYRSRLRKRASDLSDSMTADILGRAIAAAFQPSTTTRPRKATMYPPRLYRPDLHFANVFGALGPERFVTGHHSAGPKDTSDKHALEMCRSYHQAHKAKNWGGCGYHYCITRKGNVILLRPLYLKGAHVGGHNSNNVGVMFCGTTGDTPTVAQRRALKWLLTYAHTTKMPRSHRADRDLRLAKRYGHRDWAGHSTNSCPGTHHKLILSGGTAR